jgi:hypothetical protein
VLVRVLALEVTLLLELAHQEWLDEVSIHLQGEAVAQRELLVLTQQQVSGLQVQ